MPMSSRLKGSSIQNSSIDAASNVYTVWPATGVKTQSHSYLDMQIAVGTACTVYYVWSTNADGSSPFATTVINSSAALTAGNLYDFSLMSKASVYFNINISATTTIKQLWINESFDW